MYDVTALGELLLDFTPNGTSENGSLLLERNPGGAPANVLAALAKLNKQTAFIGKIGNDQFGHFLHEVLKENHINTNGLIFSKDINTTLAFVHLDADGDRSFSFYRNPGADMTLDSKEINKEIIRNSRIFHFGSISMTHEPAAAATLEAVKYAKEQGKIISFDPNLRMSLWDTPDHAKQKILEGLEFADVLKISEEEFQFITGYTDLEEGTKYLCSHYGVSLVFVTMGKKGCFYRIGDYTSIKEGFKVNAVDTTGAGDAFCGGVLYKLIEKGEHPSQLKVFEVENIALFANALAATSTTKKGGIPSMPSLSQVEVFLNELKNSVDSIGL
ncbi:PfkB family carbohydrate kinase [Bacillus taeanensis]|uniref:Carbohydrate kinase n=1 Tax=Bacillus taeanensis TaxID=273032 RepID=A0A366XYZ8_9BACI|nr:PfkB family carbohydrate kinase [Bacillus taeanensis]RBW70788.1 carbohydrate kinase [Bacillus taeanensis]